MVLPYSCVVIVADATCTGEPVVFWYCISIAPVLVDCRLTLQLILAVVAAIVFSKNALVKSYVDSFVCVLGLLSRQYDDKALV